MGATYIENGGRLRVYDGSVEAHETMPQGTWVVRFSPMEGFSLERVEPLSAGSGKVYGGREKKIAKAFAAWDRSERGLGVMLSGDKGMGKSLFLRMLAEEATERGLPVVRVSEDFDGIAEFLDRLGECMVIFDEFEKVFPRTASRRGENEGGSNRQNQFLPLFDGAASAKRFYCVTVNDVLDVSAYLVNRPGRFHYHLRFDYPSEAEIREYLQDEAPGASRAQVDACVAFSGKVQLNYDHLRAIASELVAEGPRAEFVDVVADLNIKAVEPSRYEVMATWSDGTTAVKVERLNLFGRGAEDHTVYLSGGKRTLYFSFSNEDVVQGADGSMLVPVERITDHNSDDDDAQEAPQSIRLTLMGQADYAFSAI